jgi:hypothetical protein
MFDSFTVATGHLCLPPPPNLTLQYGYNHVLHSAICINTTCYRSLKLDSVISRGFLLDLLVEQVDRPLRRVCNWNIEPGVIVPPNLADLFIIFRAQRDLLKVLDDAVCPSVSRLIQFFRHRSLTRLHRLGDHRVASRHPPCDQDLRCGCAKPLSHLLHFGIIYQLLLALHYPHFKYFISSPCPYRVSTHDCSPAENTQ